MKVLNFYHLGKKIPEGAVYIGRAMPHLGLTQSKFANPFKLSDNETRGATIERYRNYLWEQIKCGNVSEEDLLELEDKDLVCFCKQPNKEVPCHGDIIAKAVQWAINRRNMNV